MGAFRTVCGSYHLSARETGQQASSMASGETARAPILPARIAGIYKIFLSSVLAACLALYIVFSRHWLLVGDAPLFHYVVFLVRHGMAPYRDIVDLNLPGTYLIHWAAIAMLGPGAAGWRIFDFALLGLIGLANLGICGRMRFAALFAASVFALIHGRDGLIETGQRDLMITALLLGAAYFLIQALQANGSKSLTFAGGCGVCIGLAGAIKPLAFLLLPAWLALLGRARPRGSPAKLGAAACSGALLAPALACGALAHWHSVGAFFSIMRGLGPLHADTFRLPMGTLLAGAVSSVVLGLLAAWLPIAQLEKPWRKPEGAILLAGFAFGVFSFVAQGRGYPYHRYPSEAFFLLITAQSFEAGLLSSRRRTVLAAVLGLAFGSLLIAPKSLAAIRRFTGMQDPYGSALLGDLQLLGQKESLDGEVQCLDQAGGCITELYNARIVQATGFLYDCYLFVKPRSADNAEAQDRYRKTFLQSFAARMPRYVVVTSDECGLGPAGFSYRKLQAWPAFHELLVEQYGLVQEWTPAQTVSWGGKPKLPYGFRLYELRGQSRPGLPAGLALPGGSTPGHSP